MLCAYANLELSVFLSVGWLRHQRIKSEASEKLSDGICFVAGLSTDLLRFSIISQSSLEANFSRDSYCW